MSCYNRDAALGPCHRCIGGEYLAPADVLTFLHPFRCAPVAAGAPSGCIHRSQAGHVGVAQNQADVWAKRDTRRRSLPLALSLANSVMAGT